MSSPIVAVTDKVTRMIKSMVYLAMRVYYRRGATAAELSGFLEDWTPSDSNMYHEGIVERVLFDLQHEGKVQHAGARWYPVGLTR
jgi:hypothetical protein